MGLNYLVHSEIEIDKFDRVLVFGGRNLIDITVEDIYKALNNIHSIYPFEYLIEGNARGVDRIAGHWAREHKITNIKYPADWEKYKKSAGPIRNQQMIDNGHPDFAIKFPGDRGTEDMKGRCINSNVPLIEVYING